MWVLEGQKRIYIYYTPLLHNNLLKNYMHFLRKRI
uniref:Uncharacterized protein n=1 Tax=Arundo donax TaxID=35708 RepID=A0A0A9BTU2_ARUDO